MAVEIRFATAERVVKIDKRQRYLAARDTWIRIDVWKLFSSRLVDNDLPSGDALGSVQDIQIKLH